jgi:1-aminocyclopropane-1-carboxylate deaminase
LKDPVFSQCGISVDVLRIDEISPIISGNKWFKLKYQLEKAMNESYKGIITQGGAFSNHLIATAYACNRLSLKTVGIIRGEAPINPSPTLLDLDQLGMELLFVNRNVYKDKDALKNIAEKNFPGYLWVAEGGQSTLGVKGAKEILNTIDPNPFSHILCAVGTGTMMVGLVNGSKNTQRVIGIPVLKFQNTKQNELIDFLKTHCTQLNYDILYQFHEGGYAKVNPALIRFMNELYEKEQLPTDQIYTAKLLKALYQLVQEGYFKSESRILVIHSGGLQGNRSLPANTLVY